jgi:hypothetical protein
MEEWVTKRCHRRVTRSEIRRSSSVVWWSGLVAQLEIDGQGVVPEEGDFLNGKCRKSSSLRPGWETMATQGITAVLRGESNPMPWMDAKHLGRRAEEVSAVVWVSLDPILGRF